MGGRERTFAIDRDAYNDDRLKAAFRSATRGHCEFYCRPDELRNASASASRTAGLPVSRTVTSNFGWNAAFDVYRVPSGSITAGFQPARDDDPVRVDLSGSKHAGCLDLCPLEFGELARAKRHICDGLLNVPDRQVMLSPLATIALAIVHPKARGVGKYALWLTGLTGGGEDVPRPAHPEFLRHMVAPREPRQLLCNPHYIEQQGYYFRHAVYMVDDYRQSMISPDQMVRLLQAYADSVSRSRLRSDATANTPMPIRGWLVVTGEVLVEHAASALARSIVVTVRNRPKDVERGRRCVEESARYSGVTADLVRWLLATGGLDHFARRVDQLRTHFSRGVEGQQNDMRIAGNFAQLGAAERLRPARYPRGAQ